MKKSITILAIALVSFSNGVFASTSDRSVISKDTAFFKGSADVNETRFVSSADPSLIATELGQLKKNAKTSNDIITDDIRITEAVIPATHALPIKKKAGKSQAIQLKKAFKN